MNAEFLEQKIVVKLDTTGQETVMTINPATVRKGLYPGSFVGAEVNAIEDGDLVYVGCIVSASISRDGKVVLGIPGLDEHMTITYDPETGTLEPSGSGKDSGDDLGGI